MDPQPQRCLTYSTCCLCILGLHHPLLLSPWLSSCPTVEATFVPTGLQLECPREENILSAGQRPWEVELRAVGEVA